MAITDIGFGKGTASQKCRLQHIGTGRHIIPVPVCILQIFGNQASRLQGVCTGLLYGGAANIRLDSVGQGVHAGGCSQTGRQSTGHFRVQHRYARDQVKIVDGKLMGVLTVGDHSRQRSLTSGSRRGWNGNQKRNLAHDLQNPLHLRNRQIRTSDSRSDRLGAIDGRAATKTDQRLTILLLIKIAGRFHICDRGVGDRFVIDCTTDIII